jgi:hypothetical protein
MAWTNKDNMKIKQSTPQGRSKSIIEDHRSHASGPRHQNKEARMKRREEIK